ncbi:MAG: TIR domain-containing protein [Chloroflexota bacterium]
MNEIFISYCRRDKAFVERFLDGLKNNGYSSDNIWVDWEDIPASSDWEAEIKKGIETANSIIFILSPEWAKSGECAKELKFAADFNKRLFPIVWQNVDPNTLQKELASLNWIFFRETDNFDEAMQKLLSAIKTDLGWVAQHTTLLTRANEWNTKNRDDGYLLRGSELQEAETWLSQASEDKQPHPSPLQSEYIFTSRQDDVRRQRRNLILVSTGMVISVVLAIMAVISGINALRQSQKALASQLAAQSIALVDTQPDLSFLLSLEANFIGDELGTSDPAWLGSLATTLNSSPKLGTYLRAHQNDVRTLAFSPDGHWLATAGGLPIDNGNNGELYLWDMSTGTNHSQKLNIGNTDRILGVAFSADSQTLVAAGNGKTLFVWNTAQCCDPVQSIPLPDKVRTLKFATLNGHEYAAIAIKNQVTFWDLASGKMQADLTLTIKAVNKDIRILSLAFSSVNHELAAGSEDGAVTVWDLDTRQEKYHVCSYGDPAPSAHHPAMWWIPRSKKSADWHSIPPDHC